MFSSRHSLETSSNGSNNADDLGYNGFPVSLNYFTALPDLSKIEDANLAVAFKSLLKKDSITKEKSLAELLQSLEKGGKEECQLDYIVICSWLQLYPKLAIDDSKSVRALSHQVQYSIAGCFGIKNYSKYLKSSIPVWLLSLFDYEKSVSLVGRKSLVRCFQDSEEKVDKTVWIVYHKQILNYVGRVVLSESFETLSDQRYTKDEDSVTKYERTLNSAILMFVKLVQLIDIEAIDLDDNERLLAEEILLSESLWDRMASTVSKKTLNVPLFKSFLLLLKALFKLKENANSEVNRPFLNTIKNIRNIYKFVSKKILKHIKFVGVGDEGNQKLIYSQMIIQFWDVLITMTRFTSPKFVKLTLKVKKNFWQYGAGKAKSRLLGYLQLGDCNLNPIYYKVLLSFFEAYSGLDLEIQGEEENEFLATNYEGLQYVLKNILCPRLQLLYDLKFVETLCVLILNLPFLSSQKSISDQRRQELLHVGFYLIIDRLSRNVKNGTIDLTANDCINTITREIFNMNLVDFESVCEDLNLYVKNCIRKQDPYPLNRDVFEFTSSPENIVITYLNIVFKLRTLPPIGEKIIQEIINEVEHRWESDDVINDTGISFPILKLLLNSSPNSPDETTKVKAIAQKIPVLITEHNVDQNLNMARTVLNSPIFDDSVSGLYDFVEGIFDKLKSVNNDKVVDFILLLVDGKGVDWILNTSQLSGIVSFVRDLAIKGQLEPMQQNVLFKFASDYEISKALLLKTGDESDKKTYVKNFVSYADPHSLGTMSNNDDMYRNLKDLFIFCWRNLSYMEVQNFLSSCLTHIQPVILKTSLLEVLEGSDQNQYFSDIVDFINKSIDSKDMFRDLLPLDEIQYKTFEAIESVDLDLLSISNPLEQNVFLVRNFKKVSMKDSKIVLNFAKFLANCLSSLTFKDSNERIVDELYCGFLAEYIQDCLFLTSNAFANEVQDELLIIRDKLLKVFISGVETIELRELSQIMMSDAIEYPDASLHSIIYDLNHILNYETSSVKQFYSARLLTFSLKRLVDKTRLQDFESDFEIETRVLFKKPLKLASILRGCSSYLFQSKKFDRLKHLVFSELLGVVEGDQILSTGKELLCLALNFLNDDFQEIKIEDLIPRHRFDMLLGRISGWLDSEVAFDEEFMKLRCLLCSFFNLIISSDLEEALSKFHQLTVRVCSESLEVASASKNHLEVRYFALKLLLGIKRHLNDTFEDSQGDTESLHSSVFEMLFNTELIKSDEECNNQPVVMCHDLLERILDQDKFATDLLQENLPMFLTLLSECTFVTLKRVAVNLMHKLYSATQQQYAVEFQLEQMKLEGLDELSGKKASLPIELMKNLQEFGETHDSIDLDFSTLYLTYLWSWLLIFDHYKDASTKMKSDYSNQLEEYALIKSFLDSTFELIDYVGEKKLKPILNLEQTFSVQNLQENITIYDATNYSRFDSQSDEMAYLVVHLLYLSFNNFGSQVQAWFNGIRDRQLKQKVESFAKSFITPLITVRIFDDVSKSKDNLVSSMDNMSIKINEASNEIRSRYMIDEQVMEMLIKIPDTFPLLNVTVEGPSRVGVKENRWKAWLLASQKVISLTSGSVSEAIELFSKNVSLHFSGFDDCAICYSILHQDNSLPTKVCPTCLNKFHAACLYKWFKTSGASSCPLCRSPFNFKKRL